MKKRIMILAAALLLTGCAKGFTPIENSEKNTDENVRLNSDFLYADIEEALNHNSENNYEHFRILDGAVETFEMNNVCKMQLTFDTVDYLTNVDLIGTELLGEKYNKNGWSIYEHKPDPDNDLTLRDGSYSGSGFSGIFTASDNAVFIFSSKSFDVSHPGTFGYKITELDYDFFKTDSLTLEDAKAQAEKLIWMFDDSIGVEHSDLNGIYIHNENKVIEFDFKQNINNCEISSVPYSYGAYTGGIASEDLQNASALGRKSVFFNADGSYYVDINSPHFDARPIEEYKEMITFDSALEFLDNNIANNSNYEIVDAKLKYLVVTETNANEKRTAAIPVWEFQLINPIEKQRYACQINAVTGDYSFVKVKGYVK